MGQQELLVLWFGVAVSGVDVEVLKIHTEDLQLGTGLAKFRQKGKAEGLIMVQCQATELSAMAEEKFGKMLSSHFPAVDEL